MNNSKLVNLLRTFSKSEFAEFEKLAASPYFNKGRNYLFFLKVLKKFHPKFEDEKLTPEYIHSKIYSDKKFNRQIMWNMTSSLQNMAEVFLVLNHLKKNGFIRKSHLNDELFERKLTALYRNNLDKMEKELNKRGITANYFQNKTRLESKRIHYHFLEDEQHMVPPHVAKKGEYAILGFLRSLSGIVNDMRSNMMMFNARFDVNIPFEFINSMDLDKIITYARNNKYVYLDMMELYYCSIKIVINPYDTSYFLRFKELFEKNSSKFESEERKSWLTLLANYCSEKTNQGDDYYRKMLFDVNRLQLKEIEKSGKADLGKILYLQTLRNALSINEIKWAKAYIEKYTLLLKRSYQKSMRAMANAFLFFKIKDYEKVIENLSNVRFIDTRDKFFVKSLYIRTYYELGEFPTLYYHIDSARQFISKNEKLSKRTRDNFNIFINSLAKLLSAQEKNDIYQLDKLKAELEKDKALINGEWLLEKIREYQLKNASSLR